MSFNVTTKARNTLLQHIRSLAFET